MPLLIVKDEFTGGSGDLDGRVPDIAGPAWVKVVGALNEAGGFVQPGPTQEGYYRSGAIPRSPDYRVKADVSVAGASGFASVVARNTGVQFTGYEFLLQADGSWLLLKSGNVTIASGGPGSLSDTGVIELEAAGTRLRAYKDGALVTEQTDGSVSAAGFAALAADDSATHVNSFEAFELVSPLWAVA